MPELRVPPQPLVPVPAMAKPGPLAATPGSLAARESAATTKEPLHSATSRAASRVPASDIQAFDAALAAADAAQSDDVASDAGLSDSAARFSVVSSAAPGSMGEMTAALGVYRGANPAASPALLGELATVKSRTASTSDGDDANGSDSATSAGPAAPLDAMVPVAPAASVQAPVATVASPDVSVAREGAALGRIDVASIVQQVTRTLALRDLEALDAGREVVLRLDEDLLPQTVLSFKASGPLGADGSAGVPQVMVSLETRSDDVRAFLDTHGQALIDAMSQQVPGLRWVRGAANSWLDRFDAFPSDPALAAAAASAADPAQAAIASAAASASAFQGGAPHGRDDTSTFQGDGDGSGSQERESSSGQGKGQGRGEDRSAFATPASGEAARARDQAADRWSGQSEAARQQATQAFTDAVDGRA